MPDARRGIAARGADSPVNARGRDRRKLKQVAHSSTRSLPARPGRRGRVALGWAVSAALLAGGCTSTLRAPETGLAGPSWVVRQPLHGHTLDLHLIRPSRTPAPAVLVLYASGDGGWFGTAVDMFKSIGAFGYPAVGFSSRTLLSLAPRSASMTVEQLAEDYRQILDTARTALDLPASTPALLTGWSRGAAFAVLVAGDRRQRDGIEGVIAIGLPGSESLELGDDDSDDDPPSAAEPLPGDPGRRLFNNYARLGRIAPLRCAVIQATGDGYLRADAAQRRFGPDTPDRRFYAVAARNHRFNGGEAAFLASLRDALGWVAGRRADNGSRRP